MKYYIRAGAFSGFFDLVEDCGADPIEFISKVGLLASQLHDSDNMVLYYQLAQALELASEHVSIPSFGWGLGSTQGIRTIGLIGAYMSQQKTIADSLIAAQKNTHMHAQGASLVLKVNSAEDCEVTLDLLINDKQQYPQLVQLSIALIYNMLSDLVGASWKVNKICLQQAKPALHSPNFFAKLNNKIHFSANYDGIHFSPKILEYKPKLPENLIADIVSQQFKQRQHSTPPSDVDLVRHAINMLLPTGDCNKENVAMSLGVSAKTMERRLKKHHASFRQILENTRKTIALRALELNNQSLTMLALNLGYSEFSAFSRSFKQWTGKSPKYYQRY